MKLGSAFSDHLTTGHHPRSRHMDGDVPWWAGAGRSLLFATVYLVMFFVLGIRLFDLSIIHGKEYRRLSDGNKTRELTRHAPRGILLDRTGKPLVANISQYRLVAPCEAGVSRCVTYLSREQGEAMLASAPLANGQYLEVDYVRSYPYESALAHVIGYTGELSADELTREYYTLRNYGLGDRVGRMGAEAVYNERLRGQNGKELVEVDAGGKAIRSLGRQEEVPGEQITLSLDIALSQAAANAFPAGQTGAVIVTKPSTGEVLALYSSPGFSPNEFSVGISADRYDKLVSDTDLPLFNRAIGGVYPPGSTFKLVTALAGLESGTLSPSSIVQDNGSITIGPFTFPNWYFLQYGKTEGPVDLVKALKRSNDIFFYKAGEWIGITKLAAWARTVGIGKPLGIELSGEAGGLVPDPAWKNIRFDTAADKEARNNEWYLGDTYHVSIGQGYLLVTPLQVNAWTNVIANGGKLCRPTIEKETVRPSVRASNNCKDLGIKKETLALITEGMRQACDTGGTGWPLFNFTVSRRRTPSETRGPVDTQPDPSVAPQPQDDKIAVPIACKTGTAEFGDPDDNTHAWFTAFAPLPAEVLAKAGVPDTGNQAIKVDQKNVILGEPEISVTVLVEGAGEGSNVAAPIAKKILEEWFGR